MKHKKNNIFLVHIALASFLSTLFFSPYAFAVGSGGFENASYSARTLGQANAVIARPQDASTIVFNPAGIGELKGIQTNAGLQLLNWEIFHRNRLSGDHNQNNFKVIPIPSFYLTANPGKILDDRFAFGAGVNSPFGLSTSFPSVGVGKYSGYKNALKMLATTIAGSLRLTDQIRVGGGAIQYHVYDYGQTFQYPNSFILGGLAAPDGKAWTETRGGGWGWNAGAIIKPLPEHKLAVAYRSKANLKLHGKVVVEDIFLGALQGFDTFPTFESGVHTDLNLPASLTMGYAYEPSKKWSAEFDFNMTFWNVFKDQDFAFDRPNAVLVALGTIPRDYDMTWNINTGGHYRLNDHWDLTGGFFFYTAASPKKHFDNFIPDANRYAWTLGTTYDFNEHLSVDFCYLFMLFGRRGISNPQQAAKSGESIDGRYTSIIHGPMLSVNYKLDFPYENRYDKDEKPKIEPRKTVILQEAKVPPQSTVSRPAPIRPVLPPKPAAQTVPQVLRAPQLGRPAPEAKAPETAPVEEAPEEESADQTVDETESSEAYVK